MDFAQRSTRNNSASAAAVAPGPGRCMVLGHETPLGVPRSDSQQGWSDIEFVPKVFYLLTPIRLWPLLAL